MIELKFKVDPDYLSNKTIVKDPVRITISDSNSILITTLLGESGRKMAEDGAEFIFTKKEADRLVDAGVAVYV